MSGLCCAGRELLVLFASTSSDGPQRAHSAQLPKEAPFPRPPRVREEKDDSSGDDADAYAGDIRLITGPLRTSALAAEIPKGARDGTRFVDLEVVIVFVCLTLSCRNFGVWFV